MPEWSFIVECCRQAARGSDPARLREAYAAGLDWALVEAIAKRHRVEGLVHKALGEAGLPSRFAAAATSIGRQNLAHAAEAKRLHDRLNARGLVHLFVKGATLDMIAWKTLAIKKSIDIDLLVEGEDYAQGCEMLLDAGYRCVPPYPGDLPVPEIVAYARRSKDSVWRNGRLGITVELHQRLTANPALLPGISARSPRQTVRIAPGIDLPTLARDELFAYLCVHGALTAWSRLKWAADLAAFIAAEQDLDGLYRRAVQLAPRRAVAQALLVNAALFGTPLGPLLEAELRGSRRNRQLERIAMRTMLRGGAGKELSDQRFGTVRLHASIILLEPGLGYKLGEVSRQILRVADRLRRGLKTRMKPVQRPAGAGSGG
jgi:hypothetical protein